MEVILADAQPKHFLDRREGLCPSREINVKYHSAKKLQYVHSAHSASPKLRSAYIGDYFYNAARAEIVLRLSLREQGMFAFLATVGIIVGLSVRTSGAVDTSVCA